MPIDISTRPYAVAERRHYTPDYFNTNIASRIIGVGGNWSSATGLQTCAIRLSIALAYAGVHFPRIQNSWRLRGTRVYFPSYAGDYPDLLENREEVTSAEDLKNSNRRGVIYFGGAFANASGHVTLWDGNRCHLDPGDSYWDQPNEYFWEMA